jgi:hypothetical protein
LVNAIHYYLKPNALRSPRLSIAEVIFNLAGHGSI